MARTIGYYVSGSKLIDQMEESWGSQFQALNDSEKLLLLGYLIGSLTASPSDLYDPNQIADVVVAAAEEASIRLEPSKKLGLANAIINLIDI